VGSVFYFHPVPDQTHRRFFMVLHYDGSDFFGWQRQKSERTVQGEVESVLERLTGAHRPLMGSGRTDRGVHAVGQVASVVLPSRWEAASLRSALNALLPPAVWVQEVRRVDPAFHPRYDAVARSYAYLLGTEELTHSPLLAGRCWRLGKPLNPGALEEAARILPGDHSFKAFAKVGQEERGDRCQVESAEWLPWDGLGHIFTITANRYLHHMVRYLVGTMVEIALGKRPRDDLSMLLSPDRGALETSPPAPPEGLYLTRVRYPPEVALPLEKDRDGSSELAWSKLLATKHLIHHIGETE
jgi:tRNA pseudouridine38-40 synthase